MRGEFGKQLFLLILVTGYFMLIHCVNPFAPKAVDEGVSYSRLLTNQETPEAVLTNFRYAYTYKDSLIYSELFDSTFIFRSWDYNVTPPMIWNSTIYLYYDSTKTEAEMKKTFTLTFDGGKSIPTLNGEVIFKFIKRGKRWYITLWEDLQI